MNRPSFEAVGAAFSSPPDSSSALTRGIYYCFAPRDHALARAARGEVGHPHSAAGDHRPDRLVVLPWDLARARPRGAGPAARAGRPRRDRLPADRGADPGGADPGDAGVLRARRLLRAVDSPLARAPGARPPPRLLRPGRLRRALPPPVVGADPHRGLRRAAHPVAALLPPRSAGRLWPARRRLPLTRLDLRDVRGGDGAGSAARQPAAGLRQLLPDVQAGRPLLARLRHLGAALHPAVLHAGDLLPRFPAARDAGVRRRRHLGHGGPLLHDPLRQAVPRGLRGDGGRRGPGLAGHAHAQHLRRLLGPRHGGDPDGRAGALPPARAPHGAHADREAPPDVPLLVEPDLDRLDARARGAGPQDLAIAPRPPPCGSGPGFLIRAFGYVTSPRARGPSSRSSARRSWSTSWCSFWSPSWPACRPTASRSPPGRPRAAWRR